MINFDFLNTFRKFQYIFLHCIISFIVICQKIGSGGHADVSLAIWTMRDGSTIEIAVKTFRNTSNEKYNEREIEFLKKVRHRNIVSLYALTTNSEGITSLLLEYSKCGSLKNYLYAKDKNDSYLYSYDISDSLRWMHQLAQVRFVQCLVTYINIQPKTILGYPILASEYNSPSRS